MKTYQRTKEFWDKVFKLKSAQEYVEESIGNSDLDKALDWLTTNTSSIIDFGCGSGTLLYKCGLRGTKDHLGIDISHRGINLAVKNTINNKDSNFRFIEGSVEKLKDIEDSSFDAAILSNILDNVLPDDVFLIFEEIYRILKKDGKLFLKLNHYIDLDEIRDLKMEDKGQGLLLESTGLYLYNLTTSKWIKIIESYFEIYEYKDLENDDDEHYGRMFLLIKKESEA